MNIHDHLVQSAFDFANTAHEGQRRKYTDEPYIVHPLAVASLVTFAGGNNHDVAAALLHDVVEDTDVTNAEIADRFGLQVAGLVAEVTDVSKPEDGNRTVRKAIDRDHLSLASPSGKTIKLADVIDNTRSIAEGDPKFAKVYMSECADLLPYLNGGSRMLWDLASRQLERFFRTIHSH